MYIPKVRPLPLTKRVGMVSHVQMAACLAQRAVPRMMRESVGWSGWEELPFVPPPPHPRHHKNNKIVQSFCCCGLEFPSPPFSPCVADWDSRPHYFPSHFSRSRQFGWVVECWVPCASVTVPTGFWYPLDWQLPQLDYKWFSSWCLHP